MIAVVGDGALTGGLAYYRAMARWAEELGEFVLPYEAVRTAADPDRTLLEFLHTTYEAAAEHGNWDREALEADPHRWRHKR